MAVIVIPVMTDDLDPSVCTHAATWGKVVTVAFGLDGVSFEIQLGDINEKALREIFAPYVEHARPARPLVRKGKHTDTARRAQEIIRCRAWAKEKGYPVSGNGRLPDAILARYREQHPRVKPPLPCSVREGLNPRSDMHILSAIGDTIGLVSAIGIMFWLCYLAETP